MYPLFNLILVTALIGTSVTSDSQLTVTHVNERATDTSDGYSALKLFLGDEQHLTKVRYTKMIISFSGIDEKLSALIDDIADTSEDSLQELDELATMKPVINFIEFSDDNIGKATFDSLRLTTMKEFFYAGDNFEKDLLISQLKILRVISRLAAQLEEKESSLKRKAWLKKISERYEEFYQQVSTRLSVADRQD